MTVNARGQETRRTRRMATTLSVAFALVSTFVVLVTQTLQLSFSLRYQEAVLNSRLLVIAQEAGKTVSNFIEDQFNMLETATNLSDLTLIPDQERKIVLESLLGLQPAFRQFVILDPQGRQVAEASRLAQSSSGKIFNLLTNEMLVQVQEGQRYISPIYIDDATSEPLVVLALPITDLFGDFQGTLAVETNLKFMWDLVDQLKVGETGYAYVVDNTGNLIAFSDTGRVLRGENIQDIFEVSEFVENPILSSDITPDVETYAGLLGTTVVGTYVPLGTPQWALIVELPEKEAFQEGREQRNSTFLSSFAVIILAGLAGLFVSRQLAAPLAHLSYTAAEISEGNLTAEAKVAGYTEIAQLASTFNLMTSRLRDLVGNLEQRVAERTLELEQSSNQIKRRAEQFEAIARVSRIISTVQNQEELLNQVVRMISQYFGFYHVGIFLLDENKEYAVLRSTNSAGGQKMLERGHRLGVGQTGIVGYVTAAGNPRIALDTDNDAVYFDNPDLPETRSEMALPLYAGNQVIGALDVQSTQPNAFSKEDINILSTLADQVSAAIENARLHEETRTALSKAEAAYRQLTGEAWMNVNRFAPIVGYRYDGNKAESLSKSVNDQQYKSKQEEFSVPVQLRGKSIGRLRINPASVGHQWTEDEIAIIQAIAERVALAAENARLVAESQKRASREQAIGVITAKIGSSINLRNVLQTAVEELGYHIPGAEVVIELTRKNDTTQDLLSGEIK